MSIINCEYCEEFGDPKNAWLDAIYEQQEPFATLCPNCVDEIATRHNIELDTDNAELVEDLFSLARGKPTRHERHQAMLEDAGDSKLADWQEQRHGMRGH